MNTFNSSSSEDVEYVSNLPYHLASAGMADMLCDLLSEFAFAEHKVSASGPQLLIEDYELALQPDFSLSWEKKSSLKVIQEAIRLSAGVLAEDSTQLAGQLLGRLASLQEPEIQAMLKQAKQWKAVPWLRPLTPNLKLPGGPLLRTLTGHTEAINAVAVSFDGKYIISASADHTLKVWNLERGAELWTLKGHTMSVKAVTVTPNGRWAVSASYDQTLKLWDLESGQELRTLNRTYRKSACSHSDP